MKTKINRISALLVILSIFFGVGCTEHQQDKNNTNMNTINAQMVPEKLRPLIPLAEKWGMGDDGDREDVINAATPAERAELEAALAQYSDDITVWLDSFPGGQNMSDEAAKFMYMQLAAEEFDIE